MIIYPCSSEPNQQGSSEDSREPASNNNKRNNISKNQKEHTNVSVEDFDHAALGSVLRTSSLNIDDHNLDQDKPRDNELIMES